MTRCLDNLDRLCNKLHRQLGQHNALCHDPKTALDVCKTTEPKESRHHDWSVSYRDLVKQRVAVVLNAKSTARVL